QLSLCIGDAEYYLKNLNQDIDAFYLDGFSPSKNPDMWSESIFNLIHRFSKLNSTFATYSVSSSVKENATKSGFQLEKRKGFGTKKGMLVGKRVIEKTFTSEDYYINEINNRQFFKLKRNKNIKDVIIIGAGLAGISLASKLAEKKIKTTIIEKSSKEGEGASGNPAGIYSPNLTADPTFVSRLTLSGYEYFYREILDLKKKNYNLQEERIGVFQNVSSQEELERILKSIERHELKNFTVERKHKKFIYNNKEIELDGFYLNRAGWVSPKQILSLKLNQYSEYINLKFNTKVEKIQYTGNHWELYDREERLIDSCKILILANSEEINKFPETSFIFLNKIRGQICFVPLNELPINLDIILTHEEGYIIQTENFFCVGATYNNSDDNIFLEKNHNILLGERLKMIFPEIDSENFKNYEGRVGFRSATKDRIPIVGQIPDLNFFETHYQKIQKGKIQKKLELPKYKEGLFTFGAFGSRGITFSFYLAQYLANLLNGEAITLEKDLIEGISPSRFIIRDLIKKQE
ncbi:MAG: FAD-dependent 5-carboxymethylaminomethyl-2-thiouridine(34) oxidoreductase MnmC, partial [Leptospiraceae bacterium]|nr:FAD-dependent 5-carboxymethylaminomethyl-2-thiouridine(34) oxidoreductase MnmC [Leptospiraceae bacterium]